MTSSILLPWRPSAWYPPNISVIDGPETGLAEQMALKTACSQVIKKTFYTFDRIACSDTLHMFRVQNMYFFLGGGTVRGCQQGLPLQSYSLQWQHYTQGERTRKISLHVKCVSKQAPIAPWLPTLWASELQLHGTFLQVQYILCGAFMQAQ